VALLEKRGYLYNHSGDFPQVILIVPSHVPNNLHVSKYQNTVYKEEHTVCTHTVGYAIVLLMTPILKYFFSALKNIHMSGNFQKCSFFALLI
jgi:hypothetical protein